MRFVGVAHGEQNPTLAKQYSVAVLQTKILLSVPILAIGLIVIGFARTSLNAALVLWALAAGLLSSFGPLARERGDCRSQDKERVLNRGVPKD